MGLKEFSINNYLYKKINTVVTSVLVVSYQYDVKLTRCVGSIVSVTFIILQCFFYENVLFLYYVITVYKTLISNLYLI